MDNLFLLIFLASFIFLIVGIFSPDKSLFWYKQERTKKKSATIYGIILILSFILFGITTDKSKSRSPSSSNNINSKNEKVKSETNEKVPTDDVPKGVGIGQVLHTEYFDISVNKVALKDRVNTGNEFVNLKPEQGNMYLIINATFKNVDNESRMLMDGSVWINYNGKDYEFDKSETVMLEGWGLMLDQINPLTSKTTNLVYKIPAEIKGNAFWQPGRADEDQRILLGNL
jgi:hypothetical protein